MNRPATILALALAFAASGLAQGTVSQGPAKDPDKTEKLWRIETSGLGG